MKLYDHPLMIVNAPKSSCLRCTAASDTQYHIQEEDHACPPPYPYARTGQTTTPDPAQPQSQAHRLCQAQSSTELPPPVMLYPHPILRVTTIPYDFHPNRSGFFSPIHPDFYRPTRRALSRFFTSFFVALGIIFLWLIAVQCIRLLLFDHRHPRFPPPPHHNPPPHGPRPGPPPVARLTLGTSGHYLHTPQMSARGMAFRRPIITADR